VISIDGYRDLEPIGQGGLGDVYRAVRDSTGGTVAIKVLRDVSDSSVAWHRTRRELTALVSLAGHAHVVQLLELLDLSGGPALVMEYAPGGSVGGLLARRADAPVALATPGTLDVPEVVLIGRHAAAALVAAHEQGIVHRDLKPQNLLIGAYGQVKLCDFGVASLARSEEFRTRTSALSMRYASPEDLDEDAGVGPASDVYSLGATLLHLAHGAPPTLKDRLAAWQPPAADDPELERLDAVIAACLHPSPVLRPTAAEALERLESLDWTLATRCRALPVEPPTALTADEAPARDAPSAHVLPVADDPIMSFGAVRDVAGRVPDGHDTSARTVERPDRVVPPPRPAALGPRRRRWPWIAAAVATAAVLGVVVALLWPGDADAPAGPASTADADASGETTDATDPDETVDPEIVSTVVTSAETSATVDAPAPTRAPSPETDPVGDAVVARADDADDVSGDVPVENRTNPLDAVDQAGATGDIGEVNDTLGALGTVEIVDRPGEPAGIDGDDVLWPFGEVGGCLVLVGEATELTPIDCNEPHDLQRFAVDELDPDEFRSDATFDAVAVVAATDAACRRAFETFVGATGDTSRFEIAVTRPSAATWADGDRRFQCLLGVQGEWLVGDAGRAVPAASS
jgi:serine/threonine protein kinase